MLGEVNDRSFITKYKYKKSTNSAQGYLQSGLYISLLYNILSAKYYWLLHIICDEKGSMM